MHARRPHLALSVVRTSIIDCALCAALHVLYNTISRDVLNGQREMIFFSCFFSRVFFLVLSVGGADNTVALFDRSSGQTVHKMKGHTKKVLLLRERDSHSTVARI